MEGVDKDVIAFLLGHNTEKSVTDRYIDIKLQQVQKERNKSENKFKELEYLALNIKINEYV